MLRLEPYNGKGICFFCMCSNQQEIEIEETEEIDLDRLYALFNDKKYTEVEVEDIIAKFRPRTYTEKRTKLIHYSLSYSDESKMSRKKVDDDEVIDVIETRPIKTTRSIQIPICDDCMRDFYHSVHKIMSIEKQAKQQKDSAQ